MNLYLPVCDQVGTVHALVAAVTNNVAVADPFVAVRYDYSPYGELLEIATDPRLPTASRPLLASPIGFQSKLRDAETGFWYFGYRFFNSRCAQWLSHDPIREEGGFNLVAFCGGDPVNAVDPLGLKTAFGARIALGFGWDNKLGLRLTSAGVMGSLEQELADAVRVRVDLGARLYSGGPGASQEPEVYGHGYKGREYDLSASLSLIVGSGEGLGVPGYTINPFTRSAVDGTFARSFTFGQTYNVHSTMGRTRVGHVQASGGDWYLHYNNDVNKIPSFGGGTDYSWTAGVIIGVASGYGAFMETGYVDFTGRPPKDDATIPYDFRSADDYYDQGPRDLSFNRSEWFFRHVGSGASPMVLFSTPDWLNGQHKVHDGSFPFWGFLGSPSTPRFIYNEMNRFSLSLEWNTRQEGGRRQQ